jgi:hypothetical protein
MYNKTVTVGVVKHWEAPGVLKCHEVRFAGVEIEVHDLEHADLLLGILGPVDALAQNLSGYYKTISPGLLIVCMGGSLHEVHITNAPLYLRRSKSAMMQSTMWGFGVRKYTASMSRCTSRRSSMRSMSATGQERLFRAMGAARTCDVRIEHVILLDYIVNELAAVFVHNQDLPLGGR